MSNPLDALLQSGAVSPEEAASASFRWATVTGTGPIRVRLDGDAVALPDPVPMLGGTAAVGERIGVILSGRRAVGIGRPLDPEAAQTLAGLVHFAATSLSTGNSASAFSTITSNGFRVVPLGAGDGTVSNEGGGTWNASANEWTVPVTGVYFLSGTLRIADSTAARSTFLNVSAATGDSPTGIWREVGGTTSTSKRDVLAISRVERLTAGTVLRLVTYSDGANFPANAASMSALLLTTATEGGGDLDYSTPWTNVTSFANGWTNYAGGFQTVQYRKERDGSVRVRGLIKGGSGSPSNLFLLPVGYRPPERLIFFCPSTNTGLTARVDMYDTGYLQLQSYQSGASNAWVALDSIRFDTA